MKLTTKFYDACRVPNGAKRAEFRDSTTGLTMRVNDRGAKTWTLTYRVVGEGGKTGKRGKLLQGPTRRMNLGTYPNLGLHDARQKAEDLSALARAGTDPAEKKRIALLAKRETEKVTFGAVTAEWADAAERGQRVGRRGAISPRYLADRLSDLNRMVLPHLGTVPITAITEDMLQNLLDEIDAQPETRVHPGRTDNCLKALRAVFNFAETKRHVRHRPTVALRMRCVSVERERALSDLEVARLWAATSDYPFGAATRLLLLTAQRKGEVSKMKWSDLDRKTNVWNLPSRSTKSSRASVIPLSKAVRDILDMLPRKGEYVFQSRGTNKPIVTWTKHKRRLDRALPNAEPWHIHDIRHTAATKLAQLGTPLPVLSLILNHSLSKVAGVTATYIQHGYLKEKRAALEALADAFTPPNLGPCGLERLGPDEEFISVNPDVKVLV